MVAARDRRAGARRATRYHTISELSAAGAAEGIRATRNYLLLLRLQPTAKYLRSYLHNTSTIRCGLRTKRNNKYNEGKQTKTMRALAGQQIFAHITVAGCWL